MGNTDNITILLDLLLRAAGQVQAFSALLAKVRAENRDVTRDELLALYADDDLARAELEAQIAAAEAGESPTS